MTTHRSKGGEFTGDSAAGGDSWRHRVWRYAPLLLWMVLISYTSTGGMSASNTSLVVRPLMLWLVPDITDEALMRIHVAVRKTAHFVQYAVLALLAARAFLSSSQTFLRRRWAVAALLLVAVCALLDEYHQSFEPSRTATIYDSLLDISGGATAIASVLWWRSRLKRKIRQVADVRTRGATE